jgi:hypothetical protein
MAYLREHMLRSQMGGDPFLGIGLGAVVSFGRKLLSKIGKHKKPAGAIASEIKKVLGSPVGKAGVVAGGIGAVLGATGERVISSMGREGRKRRTMQVTSMKPLRRAMRRVTGFAHLAKSVMTFTTHHRMKVKRRKR